jgi:hypothetical protein
MSDLVDNLPAEPLPLRMAEQLQERDGRFVPVSVVDAPDDRRVCAILIEGRERFRGVGYDEQAAHWEIVTVYPESGVLEGLPAEKRTEVKEEIAEQLDSWARDQYGREQLVEYDPDLG